MEQDNLVKYLDSPLLVKASANSPKLIAKLRQSILTAELYEVSQILKTINFRFINNKDKLLALENLLYHGACHLLETDEKTSAQDVAILFLEATAKRLSNYREEDQEAKNLLYCSNLSTHILKKTEDWEICNKVSHLAVSLPRTELGTPKFIADSLRLLTPSILNRGLLHNTLANKFLGRKEFVEVRYHFLYCANQENAQDIAKFLVEYQLSSETNNEVDLFITQFVLQYLCLQSPIDSPAQGQKSNGGLVQPRSRVDIGQTAAKILSEYTSKHPNVNQGTVPFPDLPLLNFIHFIVSILHSNEVEAFKLLCELYKSTLNRDPNYQGYLKRIGTLYFGVVEPKSPSILSELFSLYTDN